MAKRILCLEIGNTSVCGLLINSGIKGNFLKACVRVPLEGGLDFGNNLSRALEILAAEIDPTGATCTVSIPASHVSFRTIRLPFDSEKKLRQILTYELEPRLPYPVEDLVVDYYKAGSGAGDDTELIAAAVKAASIESLLTVLSAFKLDPVSITAGGFATALCLADTVDHCENWILADMDDQNLAVFFTEAGILKQARATRLPAVADTLPLHRGRCQLHRNLQAYKDFYRPDFKPEILFTNEAGLQRPDPGQTETVLAGLSVDRVNLADAIRPKVMDTAMQGTAPPPGDGVLALGYLELTGLKGLDFRQGPFERKTQWREHRKGIVGAGILALLVLVLVFTHLLVDTHYLGKNADRLDREIRQIFKRALPDVTKIVDPCQQLKVKLQHSRRQLTLPAGPGTRANIIDLLQEISVRIPNPVDVTLVRMVIGQDVVMLSGATDTFNSVDKIKSRLESAAVFKKVAISSANLENGGNRVNFKIRVQL